MFRRILTRAAWLQAPIAVALAGAAHAGGSTAPDVAIDPGGAWTAFLAHADIEKAFPAYESLDLVGYDGMRVDAAACRAQSSKLREAVALAPVSIALHRAAMLCAEATGDSATSERELGAVVALAKHALAGTSESSASRPVRVLRPHDVRALLLAAGLEPRYAYHPWLAMRRVFPLVVASWDPERKVERHLRFDYLEATHAIMRAPEARYPFTRTQLVDAVLDGQRKIEGSEGIDAFAWRAGRGATDPAEKVAQFRLGANAGGAMSARVWVLYCAEQRSPSCAEGLVDTLLSQAEARHAWWMMLLAYAHAEGIGVPRDAAAAERLLDAADARWSRMGGSVEYARLWRDVHGDDVPLPDALQLRLERAQAAGNEDARAMRLQERLHREPTASLDAQDIAFLSQASQNGQGQGYALLAGWAESRKASAERMQWLGRAADAGDPWSQAEVGRELLYGDDVAARDRPAGLRHLTEAAHGGNAFAARLMAYDAADAGDYVAAERWLVDAAGTGADSAALFQLASLYEWERPGVSGDPARAIALYRELADAGVAEARRRLALMAMDGRHMPKNPAQARALLEAAAKDGDHAAESLLGNALLYGRLGRIDEREGVRWIERALAGGDSDTSAAYGHWLFYRKGTAASRTKALEVWRAGMRRRDDGAANNLAWALCTAPVEGFRDAGAGLEATREMGTLEDLPWGYVDTVAACRAATGDFAGAVELQKQVIAEWRKELAGLKPSADQDKQTRELEERLALYEARKPYIEPPGTHD